MGDHRVVYGKQKACGEKGGETGSVTAWGATFSQQIASRRRVWPILYVLRTWTRPSSPPVELKLLCVVEGRTLNTVRDRDTHHVLRRSAWLPSPQPTTPTYGSVLPSGFRPTHPKASLVAQWQRICLQCRRCWFHPCLRRSPGVGNGHQLQDSCLGNSMDRGAWQAIDHRVTQSQAWLKQLKTQHAHQDCNSSRMGPDLPADLSETSLELSYLCSGLA